jgi:hypothetical protein
MPQVEKKEFFVAQVSGNNCYQAHLIHLSAVVSFPSGMMVGMAYMWMLITCTLFLDLMMLMVCAIMMNMAMVHVMATSSKSKEVVWIRRPWKQQFQAKCIHTIQVVPMKALGTYKTKVAIQCQSSFVCYLCFQCHLKPPSPLG